MANAGSERGRRLGRGLDFLLAAPAGTSAPQHVEVELDQLRANPWQPRKTFDESALASLTESIRQHGVIQPVSVRRREDGYELVAGERRMLAARNAGLKKIPAIVHEFDDDQMLLVALVENVQRADLNPVDRARALKRLIDEHKKTHEDVAALAGIARSTVSNSIRLLDLDGESLSAVQSGAISEGHARALLAEGDLSRRHQLLMSMVEGSLNVRQAELVVSKVSTYSPKQVAKRTEDAKRLGRLLSERLGVRVDILERGTHGRIVIRYPSLKEFERIFERLAGEPPPVD